MNQPNQQSIDNSPNQQRIDIVKALHESAWTNFRDRRGHEHRITLSVWTLLVLLNGYHSGILKDSSSISPFAGWVHFVLIIGIPIIYTYWNICLGQTNDKDRNIAFFYSHILQKTADDELPNEFYKAIGNLTKLEFPLKPRSMLKVVTNWNHFTEILVTIFLAGSAALLACPLFR